MVIVVVVVVLWLSAAIVGIDSGGGGGAGYGNYSSCVQSAYRRDIITSRVKFGLSARWK